MFACSWIWHSSFCLFHFHYNLISSSNIQGWGKMPTKVWKRLWWILYKSSIQNHSLFILISLNNINPINLNFHCLPAAGYGIVPFVYFIFIVILLVHRTYRDEEKCRQKYKKSYDEYCGKVPFKIIPYLFWYHRIISIQ